MRFSIAQKDETLKDLASRVFRLSPVRDQKKVLDAAKNLLEANPHLANLKAIPEGTPIVVPEVPGVKPVTDESWQSVGSPTSRLMEISNSMAGVTALLNAGLDQKLADIRDTTDFLNAKELQASSQDDSQLKLRLSQMSEESKKEGQQIDSLRTYYTSMIQKILKDLQDMIA